MSLAAVCVECSPSLGEPAAGLAKSAVKGEISFGPFGDAKPEVHTLYGAAARNPAITVRLWANGETR